MSAAFVVLLLILAVLVVIADMEWRTSGRMQKSLRVQEEYLRVQKAYYELSKARNLDTTEKAKAIEKSTTEVKEAAKVMAETAAVVAAAAATQTPFPPLPAPTFPPQ